MNETGNNNNELTHNLAIAINSVSAENGSDTPDFILAELLADVLDAYNKAIRKRDEWYRTSTRALILELDDHIVDAQEMVGEDQK